MAEKIELLAPAGNLEKAKIAILYGADAVYVGGKQFSLRSRASNFSLEDLKELVDFANEHGSKVHVTVNMLPHEGDLEGLEDYLKALDEIGIHAIIAASPAILSLAKKLGVKYECHVSTQHSTTNSLAANFWKEQGMERVVLGRECEMDQIAEIAANTNVDLEVFIHGGMCISYSGRCVLSNHLTLRDANRGGCAQSCRWKYHLMDGETEISDPENLFSMSSKDLQALAKIEDFIHLGIASLKIEGRMKSAYYLATVVGSYRKAIDWIYENGSLSKEQIEYLIKEIAKAENRPTGPGFYNGLPNEQVQLYQDRDEIVTQEYIAYVLDYDPETKTAKLQVKNKFFPHKEVEIFGPSLDSSKAFIHEVKDEDGLILDVLNKPMQIVYAKWEGPIEKDAMIRKI